MRAARREVKAPSLVVVGGERAGMAAVTADGFGIHVSYACVAAGLIFGIGAILDVGILWIAQRVPNNPGWEFTALASTIEGLPRIGLAAALLALGLWLRGSTLLLAYRFLGLLLILTGFVGVVTAALVVTDWFVVRIDIPPDQHGLFKGIVFKSIALGGLYLLVFIPAGVLSMRRPRR
ncbi:MAG: hypothetical protein ACREL7_18945 [Longimicrobiales bacterium]